MVFNTGMNMSLTRLAMNVHTQLILVFYSIVTIILMHADPHWDQDYILAFQL